MKAFNKMLTAMFALAASAAVLLVPTGTAGARARTAAACTAATNIEAIVDDSGSMSVTDPSTLRVKGLKLLISTLPATTTLGAIEFGGNFFTEDPTPAADQLFPPEAVGANAAAMASAMEAKIKADNGGTDYNAAFALSDTENPGAQARIFLTDGGHDIGTYNNGHLTHKIPTYVIGFSAGVGTSEDQARLQAIAGETGGRFFPLTDSSELQSVMNEIGAAITCQTPPQTFKDSLKAGASKSHTVTIGANTKSLQIALTWASPLDKFTLTGLKLTNHGKLVAKASRHVRHLTVKTTTSETFSIVTVSGLRKGKLSFKVKAATVGSGSPTVTLVTQVGKRTH